MKWFKHISDSLDDPFIDLLIDEFGHMGYVAFFGVLEIYAREFKPVDSFWLSIGSGFICRKVRIHSRSKLESFLDFMNRYDKWRVVKEGDNYNIWVPKFLELLDDTTLKKLRKHDKKLRNRSGIIPELFLKNDEKYGDKMVIDQDLDQDLDLDLKVNPGGAGLKTEHFSYKVGDSLDDILKLADQINSKKSGDKDFNVYQWIQMWANKNGHPSAMIDSLKGLLKGWKNIRKTKFGYIEKIMRKLNGNFNEQDHKQESESFKVEWNEVASDIQDLINLVGEKVNDESDETDDR